MRLVPDDQVGDRRPGGLVVGHLVDPALLQTSRGLEHQVVEQVQDEVPRVVDVAAAPRVAGCVDGQGTLRGDQVVMDVALPQGQVERCLPAGSGRVQRVGLLPVVAR
ncbi:hypothetical protein D3C74_357790 [compost metagenome]